MPLSAVTDAGEHMHSELVTSVQRDIENVCQVPMMPGLKKKSRLVIFRVPEEDYVALTKWCTASGARSISEFVRLAVVEKVQTLGSRRVTFSGDLNTLGKTLGDLDDLLREASKSISRLLGPAGTGVTGDPDEMDGSGNGDGTRDHS